MDKNITADCANFCRASSPAPPSQSISDIALRASQTVVDIHGRFDLLRTQLPGIVNDWKALYESDYCLLQSSHWPMDRTRASSGMKVQVHDLTTASTHPRPRHQQQTMDLLKMNHRCSKVFSDVIWLLVFWCCQTRSVINIESTATVIVALITVTCVVNAELGIDISGILSRSSCIATNRTRSLNLEELDMGGPLIFVLLLACIHLLVRCLVHKDSTQN